MELNTSSTKPIRLISTQSVHLQSSKIRTLAREKYFVPFNLSVAISDGFFIYRRFIYLHPREKPI